MESYGKSNRHHDDELAESLERLKAERLKVRRTRRMGVVLGFVLMILWVILGMLGYWGAGMILAPIGMFMILWGLISEFLAYGSFNT